MNTRTTQKEVIVNHHRSEITCYKCGGLFHCLLCENEPPNATSPPVCARCLIKSPAWKSIDPLLAAAFYGIYPSVLLRLEACLKDKPAHTQDTNRECLDCRLYSLPINDKVTYNAYEAIEMIAREYLMTPQAVLRRLAAL